MACESGADTAPAADVAPTPAPRAGREDPPAAGLTEPQRAILADAELPAGMSIELVKRGATVFHDAGGCYICHGADGKGARGVGADLTDDEWWHSDGSWGAIARQIDTGVREDLRNQWGAIMPPRGGNDISDAQVRAAAAYVWTLRLFPADSATSTP